MSSEELELAGIGETADASEEARSEAAGPEDSRRGFTAASSMSAAEATLAGLRLDLSTAHYACHQHRMTDMRQGSGVARKYSGVVGKFTPRGRS